MTSALAIGQSQNGLAWVGLNSGVPEPFDPKVPLNLNCPHCGSPLRYAGSVESGADCAETIYLYECRYEARWIDPAAQWARVDGPEPLIELLFDGLQLKATTMQSLNS